MEVVINDVVASGAFTGFGEVLPIKRYFQWKTDKVMFDSGIEQRNQVISRPIRSWAINWQVMDLVARNNLLKLFYGVRGSYDSFLYYDREDNTCALNECSIIAAVDQVVFQLKKVYFIGETEAWTENKIRIVPHTIFQPVIKINGTTKTEGNHYTLNDSTGIVTFGTAPGSGATITANYKYYFKVRFMSDSYEDVMNNPGIYSNSDLNIIEVI